MYKIFLFAEDPGAASYLAPIALAFSRLGYQVRFFSSGFARQLLRDRQIVFEDCQDDPDFALREFTHWQPNLFFVGTAENKNTVGLKLIELAKKLGIKSIGAVDAMMNAPFRFSGTTSNPLAYAPDITIVPDLPTKNEFLELGFKDVRAFGHPNFDLISTQSSIIRQKSREERRAEFFPQAEGKPVVVFLAEGSARLLSYESLPWDKYSLRPKYFSKAQQMQGRTELTLAAMLEAMADPSKYCKILRMHPKDAQSDYADLLPQMDGKSQGGSAWPMMLSADLIVGATTVLLMEAAILGLPTISIVPQASEGNWLACVRQGITPCLSKMEDLRKQLQFIKKLDTDPLPNSSLAPQNVVETVMQFSEGLLRGKNET